MADSWFGLAPGLSVPGSVGLRHRRVVDLLFFARGVIFLGERPSGANWLGVALIAAGAIVVAHRF
jgi:uncharacterized membrane protein